MRYKDKEIIFKCDGEKIESILKNLLEKSK
jgi:hypothetical protein